ncbi:MULTISPECIES: branched-chain amino acid transport system II carrier protein [Kocuria]|uniref:branched-chain amino acid transport system II carrier protein n=1 Tax=Kocuria TaxID=57493 RepID=UPI000660A9E3|nr:MULTISPECIES: branched-chain amino acid transport system II carrier protein [Kocuria]MCT1368092.1 branched-chain amino acid transport system II carrier protein [Rothia sp. p3-SID1597]
MAHTAQEPKSKSGWVIAIAAMMLFSMFFGAGNLIIPPIVGVESGEHFVPAIIGFISTGVLLPVLAVIAVAITGNDVQDLARRGGRIFGLIFPILAYLSIGAFYALPRTATVSFSSAVTPVFGWESTGAAAGFSAVFFIVAFLMCLDPNGLVDKLGKYLTPALLILLAVLIILGIFTIDHHTGQASGDYATHAGPAGFVNGYLTMDSIAALAFGILVVSALRHKGLPAGPKLVRGVGLSAIIAGAFLGLIYLGLGYIGNFIPNGAGYQDGAALLADAASQTMGTPGTVVFGLIVLLACLSTAVGLLGATSEYFNKLVPKVSYRAWLVIFCLISFAVSTTGLETVLAIAGPIVGFLYPPAITLILLTLIEPLIRRRLHWSYILALTVATLWAALMTLSSLNVGTDLITTLIGWSPGHAQDLGWFVPTVVAAVIGVVMDLAGGARKGVPLGGETVSEAEARTGAVDVAGTSTT